MDQQNNGFKFESSFAKRKQKLSSSKDDLQKEQTLYHSNPSVIYSGDHFNSLIQNNNDSQDDLVTFNTDIKNGEPLAKVSMKESQAPDIKSEPTPFLSYDMGPSLEEGFKEKIRNELNFEDPSDNLPSNMQLDNSSISLWPDFSAMSSSPVTDNMHMSLQNLSMLDNNTVNNLTEKNHKHKQQMSVQQKQQFELFQEMPLIPSLGLIDDPLHFLKNQEIILLDKLHDTTQKHHMHLQSGNRKIHKTRSRLLNLFSQLNQVHQAIREIYTREQFNKQSILSNFGRWENRREKLLRKIYEIENNTSEGMSYKTLLDESNVVNNEVRELEEKLLKLKHKQKILNQQLKESKSLLDIKLNSYHDSLKSLESTEITEIESLQSNGMLQKQLNPTAITENLKLQLDAMNDMINIESMKETNFKESFVYLGDIFEFLTKFEGNVQAILTDEYKNQKEERTNLLLKCLSEISTYMDTRLSQIESLSLDFIRSIVYEEVNAVKQAIKIISGDQSSQTASSDVPSTPNSPPQITQEDRINHPHISIPYPRSNSTGSTGNSHNSLLPMISPSPFPIKPTYSQPIISTTNITSVSPNNKPSTSTATGTGSGNTTNLLGIGTADTKDKKYSDVKGILSMSKGGKKD